LSRVLATPRILVHDRGRVLAGCWPDWRARSRRHWPGPLPWSSYSPKACA